MENSFLWQSGMHFSISLRGIMYVLITWLEWGLGQDEMVTERVIDGFL
jgi:hypothetical protein